MPSIDRPLKADILHFDLREEEKEATHPETIERDGRSSRTLLKEGPLRVTLIVLGPGGGIPEHDAPGPITIQALRGQVEVIVGEDTHAVAPGELLAVDGAISHSVRSADGAAFLLTVIHTG
ncbi:MAG: cupin domain-containing protein [Gemmatimonadota bacterium]